MRARRGSKLLSAVRIKGRIVGAADRLVSGVVPELVGVALLRIPLAAPGGRTLQLVVYWDLGRETLCSGVPLRAQLRIRD